MPRGIYRNKTSLKVKSMMSVLGKLSGEFEIAAIIGGFYKYFIRIPEKTILPYLPPTIIGLKFYMCSRNLSGS